MENQTDKKSLYDDEQILEPFRPEQNNLHFNYAPIDVFTNAGVYENIRKASQKMRWGSSGGLKAECLF